MIAALPAYASDEDEFSVKVSAADTGEAEEVYVSITNDGGDFGGYVRLLLSNDSYNVHNAYDTWVSVAAGETARVTITVPLSPGMNMSEYDAVVQVLDKKEKLLFSEKQRGLFNGTSSLQYGILSNSGDELDYLERAFNYSVGWGNTSARWESIALMPSELTDGTLYQCGVLFIDDYDTSILSAEEVEAIENWTKHGGILVIGTGEAMDKTFAAFSEDFIECELMNSQLRREYSYFSMNGYLSVATLTLSPSYRMPGMSLQEMYVKYVGTGKILLCDLALSDDDLDTDYFGDILVSEISSLRNSSSGSGGSNIMSHYEMENGYGILQGNTSFSATALKLIILLYVFLIGPGVYIILNRINKREKIWFVVPAVSLLFVFLVFLCSRGFSVRGRHLTTIRVVPSGKRLETDYVFGYSAKRKPWSVSLKEDALGAGPLAGNIGYYYSSSGDNDYNYRSANTPDGTELSYVPQSNFDEAYFKLLTENDGSAGGLDFDLSIDRSRISGYVNNGTDYDFDYMLVVCNGYCQLLRDVGAGENKTMDSLSRTQYSDWSTLNDMAERSYNHEDYEEAKFYEALSFAAYSLMDESCYVIGISRGDKILEGNNSEESFLCVYKTE